MPPRLQKWKIYRKHACEQTTFVKLSKFLQLQFGKMQQGNYKKAKNEIKSKVPKMKKERKCKHKWQMPYVRGLLWLILVISFFFFANFLFKFSFFNFIVSFQFSVLSSPFFKFLLFLLNCGHKILNLAQELAKRPYAYIIYIHICNIFFL